MSVSDHEIIVAAQQHKPIFIVWEDTGLDNCSSWIMGLVGHQNVFRNVDELIHRLSEISNGEAEFNASKWLLINPN